MSDFLEQFNSFDLFTNVIPGIIIATLFGILSPERYLTMWKDFPKEKYTLFFVISYLLGIVLYELSLLYRKAVNERLFCCDPSAIVFNKNDPERLRFLRNSYTCMLADNVLNTVVELDALKESDHKEKRDIRELSMFTVAYCLSKISESNKSKKLEKMGIISDFSRELVVGMVFILLSQIIWLGTGELQLSFHRTIYCALLVFMIVCFHKRALRYQRYRLTMLIRCYYLEFCSR